MTVNEIIEVWQKWCSDKRINSSYADEYVKGDDSKFGEIRSEGSYWFDYDKKLIKELDGDNSETAKRCLRAIAAIKNDSLICEPKDIGLLSRLGFSLEYILKSKMDYYKRHVYHLTYEKDTINGFLKYYSAEARQLLTAGFIENTLKDTYPASYCIACGIAANLIKENMYSDSCKQEVIEAVGKYAEKFNVIQVLACICSENKYYADILIKKLCSYREMEELDRFYDDKNEIRKLMTYVNMQKEYRFYASVKTFGETAYKEITDEVMSDENNLVKYLNDLSESKSDMLRFLPQAAGYVENYLRNGQGQKCLEIMEEKFFRTAFLKFDFFNHSPSALYESVIASDSYKEECFSLNDDSDGSVYEAGKSALIFAKLCEYSTTALRLLFSVLKISGKDDQDTYLFRTLFENYVTAVSPSSPENVHKMLDKALENGLSYEMIFTAMLSIQKRFNNKDDIFDEGFKLFVETCKEEAAEYCMKTVKQKNNNAYYLVNILYSECGYEGIGLLLKMLSCSSKKLADFAFDYLDKNDEKFYDLIISKADTLDKKTHGIVSDLLIKWDARRAVGSAFTSVTQVNEFIGRFYNEKLESAISFIPDCMFENVRFADNSETASAKVIKYIFMEYMSLKQPERIPVCSKLSAMLDIHDLSRCIEEIYMYWKENGADTKYKMVLVPYCILASDTQILALKKQLLDWAKAARGALAAYAVNAAALSESNCALMMINSVADKFPNAMVQNAAWDAFGFAAEVRGVSREELEDRVVPSLGFDKNSEMTVDYGSRTFTITLMPDFSLMIKDNSKDKIIKSLPKPSASDDTDKAESAKKSVSEMKKQLKAVTALQKTRLFDAFRSKRTWSASSWKELFIENPVMHIFARNLIWGEYRDDKLVLSFRLSDDCTLCDVNDDEAVPGDDAEIALVHPVDLDQSQIQAWLEQLEDYEISQPFAQMAAEIYTVSDEDLDSDMGLKKYINIRFKVAAIANAAKKYDMQRGELGDHGDFDEYLLEDRFLGYGMKIKADCMYVGQEYSEEIELEGVYFYNIAQENSRSLKDEFSAVSPVNLDRRFVSCCISVIEEIIS
ncbi:MAG: DUF4132 domain-containing protein [Oscillospiraceae bacterium]|nr:DUF4132 domain-containing protein [Oscillospiraceae bacterium]